VNTSTTSTTSTRSSASGTTLVRRRTDSVACYTRSASEPGPQPAPLTQAPRCAAKAHRGASVGAASTSSGQDDTARRPGTTAGAGTCSPPGPAARARPWPGRPELTGSAARSAAAAVIAARRLPVRRTGWSPAPAGPGGLAAGGGMSGQAVAARARSRVPAVLPTYMSRVIRWLACPASRATSVTCSRQPNSAVVQKTCRRLCQVHRPAPPAARHPAAWQAASRTGGPRRSDGPALRLPMHLLQPRTGQVPAGDARAGQRRDHRAYPAALSCAVGAAFTTACMSAVVMSWQARSPITDRAYRSHRCRCVSACLRDHCRSAGRRAAVSPAGRSRSARPRCAACPARRRPAAP